MLIGLTVLLQRSTSIWLRNLTFTSVPQIEKDFQTVRSENSKMKLQNYFYALLLVAVSAGEVLSSSDRDPSIADVPSVPKKRLKRYLGFKQGAKTFVSHPFDSSIRDQLFTFESPSSSSVSISRTMSSKSIRFGRMPMDSVRTSTSPSRCPSSTRLRGGTFMIRWK